MKAFKIKRGGETYYRVDLPSEMSAANGKRRSLTAKTRAEVLQKAEEEMRRHREGLRLESGECSIEEYLVEFLDFYASEGGLAPSTLVDYRYHIKKNIVPILGQIRLRELEPRAVDQFLKALRQKGLSTRTIEYTFAVLRRALQFAVDWKYIGANPASSRMRAAKRRVAREISKIRFLDRDQACCFLAAVRGHKHEALFVLAITTGMRQGELLGLQWPDIDLEAGRLTIHRALHRSKCAAGTDGGWISLRPPKTPGSRRTIEIPPVAVDALLAHRNEQHVARMLAGSDWKESGFVFTARRGTPLDTSNVLHGFQAILKNAGLPKVRFYDLRHIHASLLIAEGVHPKKIAERLGHSSIKLTMDTYGHLFEGSDRESAERMQRIFGGLNENQSNIGGRIVALNLVRRKADEKPGDSRQASASARFTLCGPQAQLRD